MPASRLPRLQRRKAGTVPYLAPFAHSFVQSQPKTTQEASPTPKTRAEKVPATSGGAAPQNPSIVGAP
ncbi:MAG TPA: hypothetical protein DEP41_08890 [Rhodobacter sp.]|nr:hypothetical protein [Rhodobacter sp.]